MRSRRRSAKPRSSRPASKGGARTPPPNLVTSRDAAEVARLQGRLARAERKLRETGNPWDALRELGISKPGRRPRTNQELEELAGMYICMVRPDAPHRPRFDRTFFKRPDLFHQQIAEIIEAQASSGRGAASTTPTSAECVFVPDCDAPMTGEDALRNVVAYLGVKSRSYALELLSKGMRLRRAYEVEIPKLPTRHSR